MLRYLILLFLFTPIIAQATCVPSDNSCDYYQCKEQELSCGSRGYWMNFGKPYCESFLKDEKKFAPRAQTWLQDVRLCLQERTLELDRQTSCNDIYDVAMHSHVSCYVDTGFCELNTVERARVYWYLKGALRSAKTWEEATLLHKACWFKKQLSNPLLHPYLHESLWQEPHH
ncbi:hypothetical protein [Bdellovibrio bacteriovorus]|uniref:hypothetical protein n=1 Tax=Bdellovibrio bacteriovorus TaxID=959 RepID=UPI0011D1D94C|nr:hypothetical protein [Bdellovibrio bacteriovorus]